MSDDQKPVSGFVPLKSVRGGGDPAAALAEIREIYFQTSARTIEHDFAHAIELLKSLPDEAAREKAHVYMEGLAEMRKEWQQQVGRSKSRVSGKSQVTRKKTGRSKKPPDS